MSNQPDNSGSNGYVEAPPSMSGVSPVVSGRIHATTFLPDLPIRTFASIGYVGNRFLLGGASPNRYLTVTLIILGAIWATGFLPGRWWGVAFISAILVAHIATGKILDRRNYISFRPASYPDLSHTKIAANISLPVYATGQFTVEGSTRRFTCLPGFYKTFANGEHAILSQVRSRRMLGVLRWPEDELGIWYAFVEQNTIRQLSFGTLLFGPEPMPALAIEYDVCRTSHRRFGKGQTETCTIETLYLCAQDENIISSIASDLTSDEPVHEPAGTVEQEG